MKRIIPLFLAVLLLAGCGGTPEAQPTQTVPVSTTSETYAPLISPDAGEIPFTSRFSSETTITLSADGITVNGGGETGEVYTSHDIVYYEDMETYDSGNPYGAGNADDRHTAEEAAAHTVVNITAPGTYRVSGTIPAGQIRIDLGDSAAENPDAVVELILDNASITCTVAPAILFLNVYECDGGWDTDNASATVDTTAAGANLILEGENTVNGSYVAKIYKNADGEKKLWKQDGAIYSYMSMNVFGPGSLNLTAENEGLDTELHLTINGGNIAILAGNDGINTNEDGVSVTTINGGCLHIIAGLGEEGDGIDSNGYLVINGGVVVSSANPASDAGLDSDLGSYINGGTVVALGSTMDWAESDSAQVTMNLQFASNQSGGSAIVVTRADGTVIFAYDPSEDNILGNHIRQYQGAVISCANFRVGESYCLWHDGVVSGSVSGGVYDVTTVTAYENGTQMMYTGTDVGRGFGRPRPSGTDKGDMPEGGFGNRPTGEKEERATPPEGETIPEGFEGHGDRGQMIGGEPPQDFALPEGETMHKRPEDMGTSDEMGNPGSVQPSTVFFMNDKVNAFSGITPA